jgi:transcriptional regulator with XRE-family HTH domain
MSQLGERIKEILNSAHISQKKMAHDLGIPEATISAIIKAKAEPGVFKIKIIADYLGVDLNWLITGKSYDQRIKNGHNQSTSIYGKNIRDAHISIVGDRNIIYERRKDYRQDRMAEIIEKCIQLSEANRDAVIKIIDVYLDINKKQKGEK